MNLLMLIVLEIVQIKMIMKY